MSASFSKAALDILIKKNVTVIFNDNVDLTNVENFRQNRLKTKNGNQIEFEAYFVCIGAKPCTEMIKKIYPEWLDNNSFIKVNEYLNVITGYYYNFKADFYHFIKLRFYLYF